MKVLSNFLLCCLMMFFAHTAYGLEVPTISAQQLLSIKNAPKAQALVILDVRSDAEFSQGHIAGAINIPHNDVEKRLNELAGYKNTLVVVHCRSGRRAQIAETILLKQGFTNIKHLSGDFIGWQADNLPIVQDQ